MKIKHILLIAAGLLLAGCAFAQTNAGVQLTPEQLAKIDTALTQGAAQLPASYQGTVNTLVSLLVVLGVVGRIWKGWQVGGLGGVLGGLFHGSNTPKPAAAGTLSQGAGAAKLRGLLLLLPLVLLAGGGCKSAQIITVTKGTGLDLNLPLGYNGANVFQMQLRFGQFITTTAVQPVDTNRLYAPCVAVASTTDGGISAPALGGSLNSTNLGVGGGSANISGGDKYLVDFGGANSAVTNAVGHAATSANQ